MSIRLAFSLPRGKHLHCSASRWFSSNSLADKRRVLRSGLWIPTTRELPADVVSTSHSLLLRGGFIRMSSAGIYTFLPLLLRSLQKLTKIIDEEMQAIGGQKLQLPTLLSADLWKKTGRWSSVGPELIRLKDRKGSDYCLAPTHEEAITDLVAKENISYKQLPLLLYQIGNKYRDEPRPRSGLIRCREFVMKDMYSFHLTHEQLKHTYSVLKQSYFEVFRRIGLSDKVVAAEADSGNIGGKLTHEFQLLAEIGDDQIMLCDTCKYAANVEVAVGSPQAHCHTLENKVFSNWREFADHLESLSLSCHLVRTKKQSLTSTNISDKEQAAEETLSLIILPSSRQINPIKLKSQLPAEEEIVWIGAYAGENDIISRVFVEECITSNSNAPTYQIEGTIFHTKAVHVQNAMSGDKCNELGCSGHLQMKKGIEVGQIFSLEQKYSKALGLKVFHENSNVTLLMGCFGLGVTRIIASVMEACNDNDGIIWPFPLAPFKIILIPIGQKSKNKSTDNNSNNNNNTAEEMMNKCREVYDLLESKIPSLRGDLVIDDREDISPGSKMKESLLIGYPVMIIIGQAFREKGLLEVHWRENSHKELIDFNTLLTLIQQKESLFAPRF